MMRTKKRISLLLVVMVITGFLLWLNYRPVKIIAVHQMKFYSIVLVEGYPFTDKGKIDWWIKNKSMLKTKYDTPQPEADGGYNVMLWDFDEGYKEEGKYDRLCFDDMPPPINCVDKNAMMTVSRDKYNVTDFTLDNGVYILQDNGQFVKRK